MIRVDNRSFSAQEYRRKVLQFPKQWDLGRVERRIVGLCSLYPVDLLAAIDHIVHAGGSVLLLPDATPEKAAFNMAQEAGCARLVFGSPGGVAQLPEGREVEPPSVFQHSSGTTGVPKLVQRPWSDVQREIESYNSDFSWEAGENAVVIAPISHSFGLISGVLSTLARGCQALIVTDRNPKYYSNLAASMPQSIVYSVPFVLHMILSSRIGPLRLNRIISSGSALTGTLLQQLKDTAQAVGQQYGTSEIGCISLSRDICGAGDVGFPLKHLGVSAGGSENDPAEIRVLRDGELLHTGDIGFLSSTGSLQLLNRLDDLINVCGFKVIPFKVEQVIGKIQGVDEVAVYGGKHPVWGESVKAMIAGKTAVSPEEIRKVCIENLSRHEVPTSFEMVEKIPKTRRGKLSRRLLQEMERANGEAADNRET